MREIEINGVVNINMSEKEFSDAFIDFIESIGGYFGGGIKEYKKNLNLNNSEIGD